MLRGEKGKKKRRLTEKVTKSYFTAHLQNKPCLILELEIQTIK